MSFFFASWYAFLAVDSLSDDPGQAARRALPSGGLRVTEDGGSPEMPPTRSGARAGKNFVRVANKGGDVRLPSAGHVQRPIATLKCNGLV